MIKTLPPQKLPKSTTQPKNDILKAILDYSKALQVMNLKKTKILVNGN
ncbi:MAG: hypothetical protein HYU67_10775 [Flavobacteriia bacterium]|nr:hypothetical protein [Flavobacteriia bacterium]